MSQQWNPTDILQLSNVGQCLGYAPSKGRRCRVSIRYHDIRRCQTLITEMAEQRPEPCVLKPMLECLAAHGLCVRFHQYQVDDMVRKWNRMILSAYPPIPLDLISNEISSVMSSISSPYTSLVPVSRQSTSALTASSVSLPDHSEVETLQDTIAVMQETIRTAQRRLEVLRYTPPVTAFNCPDRPPYSHILTLCCQQISLEDRLFQHPLPDQTSDPKQRFRLQRCKLLLRQHRLRQPPRRDSQ
jgi:hypothetical protein